MLCLWSVGLLVEIIVRGGLAALRQMPAHGWTFSLTLPLAAAVALSAISLAITCAGLWRTRSWARRLFLLQITLYYGLLFFSSIALWGPVVGVPIGEPGQGWVTMVLLEGVLGLGFGWWYLNRDSVRAWFTAGRQTEVSMENRHDDSRGATWG